MFSKSLLKKLADNRKKNTVRKITKQVKEFVIQRDKICIICWNRNITQIHHCYYWNQAVYSENRNDPDQLVWLCDKCHHILHFDWSNIYREDCIKYLQLYYEQINFLNYVPNNPNQAISS